MNVPRRDTRTVAGDADGVMVDCEYICGTIVQSVALLEIKVHGEGLIVVCKSDATRYRRILTAFLVPKVEYVTGDKDSRWVDDSFNHICAVVAWLVICGAIREGNRKEPTFRDFVVV